MTPRQAKKRSRRLRSEQIRESKVRARLEKETPELVRGWLAKHPPRAAGPIEFGNWKTDLELGKNLYEVNFFGMREVEPHRWRPEGPVVRVPVMDHRFDLASYESRAPGHVGWVEMRAVRMGMRHNDTEIRWYNWEPTRGMFGDAEADIYRAAGKVEAFLTRVRMLLKFLPPEEYIHTPEFGPMPARMGLEWMNELLDGLEQWRGRIRTFYVVPGKGGSVEQRATA